MQPPKDIEELLQTTRLITWRRPENVLPRVWLREQGVVVRDLTPDFIPYALEHMKEFFLRDEPTNKAAGTINDPLSVHETCVFWEKLILAQGISLVALLEGTPGTNMEKVSSENPPVIIGVNQLIVMSRSDPPWPMQQLAKSEIVRRSILLHTVCSNLDNIFDRYNVDTYLDGYGMSVLPEWRGKGVGPMLMRAREALCRELGITVTKAIFTNAHAQKMAVKTGFELLGELDFSEIKTLDGQPLFKMNPEQKKIQLTAKRILGTGKAHL